MCWDALEAKKTNFRPFIIHITWQFYKLSINIEDPEVAENDWSAQ